MNLFGYNKEYQLFNFDEQKCNCNDDEKKIDEPTTYDAIDSYMIHKENPKGD